MYRSGSIRASGKLNFKVKLYSFIIYFSSSPIMADYVPALQARMGDWKYYVTVMKMMQLQLLHVV
jgi:hypothetical protein